MKKLILLTITSLFVLSTLFSSSRIKVAFTMKYSLYNNGKYTSVIYSDDFPIEEYIEDDEEELTFNGDTKYEDASFDPVGTFYLFSVFSNEPIVLETLQIKAEKPIVAHYVFSLLDNGEISYEFQDSLKINMSGIPEMLLLLVNKYFDEFES